MEILLISSILCTAYLTATGILPLFGGTLLILGGIVWLSFVLNQYIVKRKQMAEQQSLLRARWGLEVRIISGLPLLSDVPAVLYSSHSALTLVTEQERWHLDRNQLERIMLASADQIRRLSDRQLANLLLVADRTFVVLRERIRNADSQVRSGSLLFISDASNEIWVLVVPLKPLRLLRYLTADKLDEKLILRLPPRLKKAIDAPKEVIR